METALGVAAWVAIFYPWWSPRCRRKRAERGISLTGVTTPVQIVQNSTIIQNTESEARS